MSVEDILNSLERLNLTPSANSNSHLNISHQTNTPNINLEKINHIKRMSQFKPEYLNCVPVFNGNPSELNRFLAICKSLIDTFYDIANPQCFQNIYLLNSLIGKLSGNAKLIVNVQNVTNWDQLKDVLYRNFADRRDEACLNRDLVMLRQNPNESAQDFYDRCLEILNLLCSYVDAHETTLAASTKRDLYKKLALKTFLSGLREPLGNTIRCMRPKDLTEAIQLVLEENNIKYFQGNSFSQNKPQNFKQNQQNSKPQQHFNNFRPNFNTQPRHNFDNFNQQPHNFNPKPFPSQPINIRPNPNYVPPRQFTNAEVFGQQNRNVFKPDPSKPLPKPTPMSISTRQTYKPNFGPTKSNFFKPSGPRNFISEELFNTQCSSVNNSSELTDQSNYEYSDQYDYQNFDQPEYDYEGHLETTESNDENFTEAPPTTEPE